MMDDMLEERLGGGRSTTGVVRIGETLRRPVGPWTPTIHAFLRHLHASGFAAAPEVFGLDDQGREILSYIPGETWGDHIDPDEPKTELVTVRPWPEATRSESALAEIGRLYSDLHRAARGFRPTAPIWREYELPMHEGEVVCHGDAGPWNVVYREGLPVALIDWDGAQPNLPINDLATIAWSFVPLGPDDFLHACGFTEPFATARRLRVLCEAYGLADRLAILPALNLVKQLAPMKLRYWQPIPPRTGAAHLRFAARDLDWLEDNTGKLRSQLV
ncbi:MAG: aminoglycoside phosphotransferase family protein [Chloroflexi bacterium]|nr:MAG: aminoglycoside phosphotransferase family protein [Chloroflexota bacterium]TMG35917.1 MAG: aminoglycoside phosphotransferase family protein [Chloroflexota bacterium]